MVSLDREARTAATEQEPEGLLKEARTITVADRAVINSRVLALDRITRVLECSLRSQHPLCSALRERPAGLVGDLRGAAKVHVLGAVDRFGPGAAARLDAF